jgi:hypothetical protein
VAGYGLGERKEPDSGGLLLYLTGIEKLLTRFGFFSQLNLIFFLLLICAYNVWVISPPFPHALPYPPAPSFSPPPPHYPAETILPLSLILLKREYKQ